MLKVKGGDRCSSFSVKKKKKNRKTLAIQWTNSLNYDKLWYALCKSAAIMIVAFKNSLYEAV